MTFSLLLLSVWRIAVCFEEYEEGFYVPYRVALVDTAPFACLGLAIAAWRSRGESKQRMRLCALGAFGLLLVTACDRFLVTATFREDLRYRAWRGLANLTPNGDDAEVVLTFTEDKAELLLGSTNRIPIFRGAWSLEPDMFRSIPRVRFQGFGTADYRKGEHLKIEAVVQSADGPTNLVAYLLQSGDSQLRPKNVD